MMLLASPANALQVTILMTEEIAAFHEFAESFIRESRLKKLDLDIHLTQTLPDKTDLIIAVGLNSAISAGKSNSPVLCVFVTKAGFENIIQNTSVNRKKNTISAIYLDQPIKRQVALIAAALPEIKRIGLLHSSRSPDLENYRKATNEKGLVFRGQKLESADSLHRDLELLLNKSNVLLAIPDAEVYNSLTMRNILMSTYRAKVPVVGFSSSFVKAGALFAVISTPSQIAAQATIFAGIFAANAQLPVPQYPVEFHVMFNQQVARSLGIPIKEYATLIREIQSTELNKQGVD
jgi:ABC-type uncharacterized transport system substrate-binding protein